MDLRLPTASFGTGKKHQEPTARPQLRLQGGAAQVGQRGATEQQAQLPRLRPGRSLCPRRC
eukprot:COSAG02_NODE_53848_length_299_cov_0.925000_1_plen_60_part_10